MQVSFASLPATTLERYSRQFSLTSGSVDRSTLVATVHSHFDAWQPPAAAAEHCADDGQPKFDGPPGEAAIVNRFVSAVIESGKRAPRRGRRGRRKRTAAALDDDDERGPAADWDALPTADYGKGRRQRKAKVKTDV